MLLKLNQRALRALIQRFISQCHASPTSHHRSRPICQQQGQRSWQPWPWSCAWAVRGFEARLGSGCFRSLQFWNLDLARLSPNLDRPSRPSCPGFQCFSMSCRPSPQFCLDPCVILQLPCPDYKVKPLNSSSSHRNPMSPKNENSEMCLEPAILFCCVNLTRGWAEEEDGGHWKPGPQPRERRALRLSEFRVKGFFVLEFRAWGSAWLDFFLRGFTCTLSPRP